MSSVRQSSLDLSGLGGDGGGSMELSSDVSAATMTTTLDASGGSGYYNSSPLTLQQQPSTPGSASDAASAALPMKLGSLQEFVTHMCDTSEMGPGRFSASDVHRIGILDIRLFNTDRHAGNMLVRAARTPSSSSNNLRGGGALLPNEQQYELIPIDHGFCLPETLEACYFEWLHWPQVIGQLLQESGFMGCRVCGTI
jgi:hypothetical protein